MTKGDLPELKDVHSLAREALVAGDEAQAREILEQAKESDDSAVLHYTLAKSWHQLFEDRKMARKSLVEGGKLAKDMMDIQLLAWGWVELLQQEEQARELLFKAEEQAEDFHDVIKLLEIWRKLFHDRKQAPRILELAEGKARERRDFLTLASEWRELGDDKELVRSAFRRVAKELPEFDPLGKLARAWEFEFKDDEAGILMVLGKADIKAKSEDDFIELALLYRELLGDRVNYESKLRAAKLRPGTVSCYVKIADHLNYMGRNGEAVVYLERAVSALEKEDQQPLPADVWEDLWNFLLFLDHFRGRKHLLRAEELATTPEHYEHLAGVWREWKEEKKATRLLRLAEKKRRKRALTRFFGRRA